MEPVLPKTRHCSLWCRSMLSVLISFSSEIFEASSDKEKPSRIPIRKTPSKYTLSREVFDTKLLKGKQSRLANSFDLALEHPSCQVLDNDEQVENY